MANEAALGGAAKPKRTQAHCPFDFMSPEQVKFQIIQKPALQIWNMTVSSKRWHFFQYTRSTALLQGSLDF